MSYNSKLCSTCGILQWCNENNKGGCSGHRTIHEQKEIERVNAQQPFKVIVTGKEVNSGIALWHNTFIGKTITVKDIAANPDCYNVIQEKGRNLGYAIDKINCTVI